MELLQLRGIVSRDPLAKKFVDQFVLDEFSIQDLDSYIDNLNTQILGTDNVNIKEHPNHCLGIIYCRALKLEFNPLALSILEIFAKDNQLSKTINIVQEKESQALQNLLLEIKNNIGWPDFYENRKSITGGDTKWKSGDIFALKHESGQYLIGRILLNTTKCLKGKEDNARTNGLGKMKNFFLCETYDGLYNEPLPLEMPKVVLNGILVYPEAFKKGFLTKIGTQKVKIEEIDFPEYLTSGLDEDGNRISEFRKGELIFPLPNYTEPIEYSNIINQGHFLDQYTFMQNGNSDLVKFHQKNFDLRLSDLRFQSPERRTKIYTDANIDASKSYVELCELHQIDIRNYLK